MQKRIVAAVAQDQAVVPIQHLACILSRSDHALLKERIAERALSLVHIGAVMPRFARDDLKGFLRKRARRAAEDAHTAVLRNDKLPCGIGDLDMRGHLQFLGITRTQLVKITRRERQRYRIQRRAFLVCLDIRVRDDSADEIAVGIKARGAHDRRVLTGHGQRICTLLGPFGRHAAVGGIAHNVIGIGRR